MPGCCVPQCTNHCRKGVRMFRFPTSPNRRKRWIAQVKRDCWEPTTASRVCEVSTGMIARSSLACVKCARFLPSNSLTLILLCADVQRVTVADCESSALASSAEFNSVALPHFGRAVDITECVYVAIPALGTIYAPNYARSVHGIIVPCLQQSVHRESLLSVSEYFGA